MILITGIMISVRGIVITYCSEILYFKVSFRQKVVSVLGISNEFQHVDVKQNYILSRLDRVIPIKDVGCNRLR